MTREIEDVCEYCRKDLPRHVVGRVWYCSEECCLADEGLITCPECGSHHYPETLCCLPLGGAQSLPPVLFGVGYTISLVGGKKVISPLNL